MERETNEASSTDQRVTSPQLQGNLNSHSETAVRPEQPTDRKITDSDKGTEGTFDPSDIEELASLARSSHTCSSCASGCSVDPEDLHDELLSDAISDHGEVRSKSDLSLPDSSTKIKTTVAKSLLENKEPINMESADPADANTLGQVPDYESFIKDISQGMTSSLSTVKVENSLSTDVQIKIPDDKLDLPRSEVCGGEQSKQGLTNTTPSTRTDSKPVVFIEEGRNMVQQQYLPVTQSQENVDKKSFMTLSAARLENDFSDEIKGKKSDARVHFSKDDIFEAGISMPPVTDNKTFNTVKSGISVKQEDVEADKGKRVSNLDIIVTESSKHAGQKTSSSFVAERSEGNIRKDVQIERSNPEIYPEDLSETNKSQQLLSDNQKANSVEIRNIVKCENTTEEDPNNVSEGQLKISESVMVENSLGNELKIEKSDDEVDNGNNESTEQIVSEHRNIPRHSSETDSNFERSSVSHSSFIKLDSNSLNLPDNLEEYGAAGGYSPSESPVSVTATLSGRTSNTASRKSSALVNGKLSIPLHSQIIDDFSPRGTDADQDPVLAQGDGPSPHEPLQPLATQSTPNVRPTRTSYQSIDEIVHSPSSSSGSQVKNRSSRNAMKETSKTLVAHSPIRRTDSVGQSVSPTDLLRKKQKLVTDKIMKSLSATRSRQGTSFTSSLHDSDLSHASTQHLEDAGMVEMNGKTVEDKDYGKEAKSLGEPLKSLSNDHNEITGRSESGKDILSKCSSLQRTSAIYGSDFLESSTTNEGQSQSKQASITESNSRDSLGHHPFKGHQTYSKTEKETDDHPDLNLDQEDDIGQSLRDGVFSYTTPSKLLRKMEDREKSEKNFPGIGATSFTSPSKVLKKIEDRENNDKNFPGIGTFSYTTPSQLLRRVKNRDRNEENSNGYGTLNYTSPSELLMKTENLESKEGKSSNCEQVYNFKNKSHTSQTSQNTGTVVKPPSEGTAAVVPNDPPSSNTDINVMNAGSGGDDNHQVLDFDKRQFSQTGQEIPGYWFLKNGSSSHSDSPPPAESQISILNPEVPEPSTSVDAVDNRQQQENLHVEAERDEEGIHLEFDTVDVGDFPSILKYMNILLTDFLGMLAGKRQRGEAITEQDYEELTVIETAIQTFASQIIRSVGNLEGDHNDDGIEQSDDKKNELANNLRYHLSLLASAKLGMRENLHAQSYNVLSNCQSPDSKEQKKTKERRSKSSDVLSLKKHKAVEDDITHEEAAEVEGRKRRRESLNQMFWAIEENGSGRIARSERNPNERVQYSGYLGDVSSDSLGTTSICGWDFSDQFLKETASSVVDHRMNEMEIFGSEVAPSSSSSLGKEIAWTSADSAEYVYHNSANGKRILCDCHECRKRFLYWNERVGMTPAFNDIDINKSENDEYENEYSRLANAGSRVTKGTPYPSSVLLTSNPSFSNLSDYSYDDSDIIECERRPQYQIESMDDEIRSAWTRSQTGTFDQRGEAGMAKRKQAGRSLTPDSKYMLDKEVVETQNRKLQTEISTLQTENKLLKEKHNRSQAHITELEEQLSNAQEDLGSLQETLNQEVSSLSARARQEIDRGREDMQAKIVKLTKENEALKSEVAGLEKQLDSSNKTVDMVRHNTEKTRTLEAHKQEITSLKEELNRVKALLDQSERHLRDEEERHSTVSTQVVKLTELKNALQQQQDAGSGGTVGDKQLKSLEKRLAVTEERLHQERADRANNLSAVEDKLLTENARLQAVEKDLTRQLHREKEKNRNLDHRVKQVREENEKLRLAIPFDDSKLLEDKQNYDIPYSSHSNQRAETVKHISDDMNYILSQIEKQDDLQDKSDQEEMIRTLWNKRELAYQQLREYELNIQELHLNDNNIMDGLKNLRDTYGQAETKLRAMEEQVEDARAQMVTLEATYKEQLNVLVHERHDAFARLKTAEDILAAVRAENEMLRQNVHVVQAGDGGKQTLHNGVSGSLESLQMEITNLESKVAQLTRTNQRLEGELNTARTQVEARNKTLQDVQSELDLTYKRLKGEDTEDRKQSKIDKLSSEVSGLQVEMKMLTDKYNSALSEKSRLESEMAALKKTADVQKVRQQKTGQTEGKVQQHLKDEIAEKGSKLESVTKQLNELENELQKSRQELYIEQMHNTELESEVESLRHTVEQRAQMFESLSGTEREQLAQYQILKETLDSVNQELAQKHAQIISLDVNLSGQKDRTGELEAEVAKLRRNKGDQDIDYTDEEQSSGQQLRITELERERSQLKQELVQAYNAIQAAEEQYRILQTESAQLEQELVKEKTVILQITAEKGEVEQHLEELAEEHDSLIQEKNQCEEDLIRLETKLQEILQKYETEARKQHSDFTKDYPNLPPEAKKLVSELDSLRLLVEGKDREIGMLQDKNNRQLIDIEFLHRKVELVHNDSISNREDVARMISELTLKMKEAVSTREVNQFLVAERTKVQNERAHLDKELEQERKNNDQRKREIENVLRKVQGTETRQKSAERDSRDKETLINSLEADLHNTKQIYSSVETEMAQLKNRLGHQNEDIRKLTEINSSIEQQLEAKSNKLLEETSALSKLKEEFSRVSHDFELLQHEHTVLSDKHTAHTQTIENLRRELSTREEENSSLQEELHGTRLDLESQKGQLLITKDTVQKLSQDKGSIYQDYEGMCRTVTEKERQLTELRERSDEKLDHIQKQHLQEKTYLQHDKISAEQERDVFKRELESLQEQLEQKEVQLTTFGKTLQELESVTRQKNQLEAQLHQLESSSGDSKVLLEGQRKELMALNEALAKQQDRSNRIEAENHTLKADLKTMKDSANRESQELSITVKELKSQHENERTYLNDNLGKTQTQLRSVEASLVSASNERDTLQAQKRMTENSVDELQSRLSDESTGRRLAEQSIGQLRLQLEDTRNEKNVSEARYTEMKNQLSRAEEQLKTEQSAHKKLSTRIQEMTTLSHNSESSAKAKEEQMETLQKDMSRLRQMLESQKQIMTGKMKKAQLEFKQKLDQVQEDRDKLMVQVQKLSTDLEGCREQLALKNKDNLKLQEDMLVLEDSLRECKTKQKQAEETLKIETEKLSTMASRFMEQDEELKRLRNFLAKKAEDSGEADKSMWQEMNRVIQDLSRQMHDHLDAQRSEGKDGSSHTQVVLRYKKQLAEIQGELSTEKSLHQITKTSLQALEEDCQRLRHQLHAMRRREPANTEKISKSPGPRKYKNRMEAINAIIARSQTQAQALLASGGFYDNMNSPRVPNSARVGYHSPQRPESPDNSYSEDLSVASLPPLHYGSSARK